MIDGLGIRKVKQPNNVGSRSTERQFASRRTLVRFAATNATVVASFLQAKHEAQAAVEILQDLPSEPTGALEQKVTVERHDL